MRWLSEELTSISSLFLSPPFLLLPFKGSKRIHTIQIPTVPCVASGTARTGLWMLSSAGVALPGSGAGAAALPQPIALCISSFAFPANSSFQSERAGCRSETQMVRNPKGQTALRRCFFCLGGPFLFCTGSLLCVGIFRHR